MDKSSGGKLKFKAHAISDVGQRKNNEDAWLISDKTGLFIVADGMGGHDKGEVASRFTADNLRKIILSLKGSGTRGTLDHDDPVIGGVDADDLVKYAVLYINKQLYEENEIQLSNATKDYEWSEIATVIAKKKRMGTTLVSLLFHEGHAYLTHIGDSRAYRIAGDSAQRLTLDHSWVEEKIREGEITPEEAKRHEKRNVITRSVGFKKDVLADIDVFTVHPPERFLLCSDGLSNVLDEKALAILGGKTNIQAACEELVSLAKDRGGRDNITALLVDVVTEAKDEHVGKIPSDINENTDW